MSYQHNDYVTLLAKGGAEADVLTRPGFDVSFRLMHTSGGYRGIVDSAARYIQWCATTEKVGYSTPKGWSGANAGIPLNIVALASGETMINPRILKARGENIVESNCGSLLLDKPVWVKRYAEIVFEYWDINGVRHERVGYYPTVQHEIDHNQGILITDRAVQ